MSSGVQMATDGIIARNTRSQGVSMATSGVISYYISMPIRFKFIREFLLNMTDEITFRLER